MLFFTYRRSTMPVLVPDSIAIIIIQKILHQIERLSRAVDLRTEQSAYVGFGLWFNGSLYLMSRLS